MKKTAVVTGLGPISAIGCNVSEFEKNLFAGVSGIKKLDPEITRKTKIKNAALVDYDAIADYVQSAKGQRIAKCGQYALAGCVAALEDSGVSEEEYPDIAIYVGANFSGAEEYTKSEESKLYHRRLLTSLTYSCSVSHMAAYLNSNRDYRIFNDACATGGVAIGEAMKSIENGEEEMILAGASDQSIMDYLLLAAEYIGIGSTVDGDAPGELYCPFDIRSKGAILGEGAGIIMVEEKEHALKRGAHIYCELGGYKRNTDCFSSFAIEPNGTKYEQCLAGAINSAGIAPEDISFICAHGTGTVQNDRMEAAVIHRMFHDSPMVTSIKPMVGHTFAASGALNVITAALALKEQCAPPTLNYRCPNEDAPINIVANTKKTERIDNVLSIAMGLGGINTAIVLRRYTPDEEK